MRNRIKTVAMAALVSALTVAGLAIAQGDGGDPGGDDRPKDVVRHFHAPPPGAMVLGGPGRSALTYSETHLRRDGEEVVVRADKGKLVSADAESIAIERNDGETVEVAVDADTKVLLGPGREDATVEDIAAGKQVVVIREDDDQAAEAVVVPPKHPLQLRRRLGAPPPGAALPAPAPSAGDELPAPPPGFGGERG